MTIGSLGPKDATRLLNMIATVVAKQGGRVKVSPEAEVPLQKRTAIIKSRDAESITFTLMPEDGPVRDAAVCGDMTAYRTEILLKYLISIAPGKCLTLTSNDINCLGKFYLNFNPEPQGLVAVVSHQATPAGEGSRTFVVENGIATLVPLDGMSVDKMPVG